MPAADPDTEALFDAQVRGGAAPPAAGVASGPADADTEAAFEKQLAAQPPPPSEAQSAGATWWGTAKDVAKQAGAGFAEGAQNLLAMPGNASQGFDKWTSYGLLKAAELASPYLPKSMRLPGTAEEAARASYKLEQGGMPTGIGHGDLSLPTSPQTQAMREAVTGPLPEAQTPAGEVSRTVGSFVPGALMAPGNTVAQVARNAIGYGVIPGLASEGAGRLAKTFMGDSWEPVGRAAGAIGGTILGHGASAPRPTDTVLSGASRGISDQQIADAQALSQRTTAGQGFNLSGPEAVAATTNGGAQGLTRMQRLVEGSPQGAPIMSNFYAQRPAQMQAAARTAFDTIAPPTNTPSALGAQGQQAAQANLKAIQDNINAAARPYYAAAENHLIPQADFQPIADDPTFRNGLERLRNNPDLKEKYAAFPDNSIKVIDAVTKDMRARGESLANVNVKGYQPEASATNYAGATSARDIARNPALGGNVNYDVALGLEAARRQQFLAPQQAGPIGQIAGTPSTGRIGEILYPNAPQPGSQGETANAVRALENQQPGLPAQLTRQHLEAGFNNATQENMTGPNQYGGAKFASTMFGHPQQAANTYAGLAALPNNPELQPLIQALRATGFREPPGSQTHFNELWDKAMTGGNPAAKATAIALSPESWLGGVKSAYDKYRMGANKQELATAMTSPDFFNRLNTARRNIPPDQYRSMIVQSLLSRGAVTPPVLPAILQPSGQPNKPD